MDFRTIDAVKAKSDPTVEREAAKQLSAAALRRSGGEDTPEFRKDLLDTLEALGMIKAVESVKKTA